ncbi:MAG TPA: CopG family antitoxin [Ktedonobacterales bacterium]|nr:CopG family antitoxin [Ktedonobacterales bacterium]
MTDTKKPIPDFKNRQEMAEWFDTHDMTDYDFKPVRVRFAKKLSEGLSIRLDPETLGELRKEAQQKGIGPTTLVRMWVMEHLRGSRNPHNT